MPALNDFDVDLAGLNPLPSGSLLLLASHDVTWRDSELAGVAFSLIDGGANVQFHTLAERPEAAKQRFNEFRHKIYSNWSFVEADKKCPKPRGYDQDAEKARHAWEEGRNERANAEYKDLLNLDVGALQWGRPDNTTLEGIESAIRRCVATQQIDVCIIDDLSAIRRDHRKSGSPKLCGEYARALKDLALDMGILIVAGLPAPRATVKVESYGSQRRQEREKLLEINDLASYGSPHEACDALVTAHPNYAERKPHELIPVALVARYGTS
jgi:hypothetical protein